MRIGVFKGAFAPVLQSQIQIAQEFCKEYQLDVLYFEPVKNHELSVEDRVQMLKLATKAYRKFQVGIPKTYDVELQVTEEPFDFQRDWVHVTKAVRGYMMSHDIYIERIAQSLVTEKRWNHVKSMTQLAMELAECHHVSLYEAKLAGMFHDATKRWSTEESLIWMRFCAPKNIEEASAVFHQYTGAAFAKRVLKIRNQSVLQAILHHVKGDDAKKLSRIIYIADKLDPSRDYDSSKEIALCKKDLDAGFKVVQEQQLAYLRKEGVQI